MSDYVDEDGWTYTTHRIRNYDGNGLTEFFAMLREDYEDAGKEVREMLTYNNSGFNHATQKQEQEPEFGIEVIWK
jgi:hypothetical protein